MHDMTTERDFALESAVRQAKASILFDLLAERPPRDFMTLRRWLAGREIGWDRLEIDRALADLERAGRVEVLRCRGIVVVLRVRGGGR